MKNIFENAKFGDFFLTRDGKKAVFIRHMNTDDVKASCVIEGWFEGKLYHADGKVHYDYDEYDIVGKWKENIDEEELDKLAYEYAFAEFNELSNRTSAIMADYEECANDFKAGYRKALEK